jgi:hypothetical protein
VEGLRAALAKKYEGDHTGVRALLDEQIRGGSGEMLATRAAQATATTDCLRAALTAQTADARADALSQLRRHLAAGGLLHLDAAVTEPMRVVRSCRRIVEIGQ